MLSFRFFSTLFSPVGQFWYHFGVILTPLGPQKHNIFIQRVIKFQLLAIFVVEATFGHETHLKKLQMLCPSTPNGTPEEPRSAQESPRRAPRASRNHPQRALRVPLGVQKVSWSGFGSLGASFWSPQGQFYLVFPTFPNVLFSLLSLFSHICYMFILSSSLFSRLPSLCSRLSSRFSSVNPSQRVEAF